MDGPGQNHNSDRATGCGREASEGIVSSGGTSLGFIREKHPLAHSRFYGRVTAGRKKHLGFLGSPKDRCFSIVSCVGAVICLRRARLVRTISHARTLRWTSCHCCRGRGVFLVHHTANFRTEATAE